MNNARNLAVEHDISLDTAVYTFIQTTEERITHELQAQAKTSNEDINEIMLEKKLYEEREKIEHKEISNATKHEMLCLINIIEERLKAKFS